MILASAFSVTPDDLHQFVGLPSPRVQRPVGVDGLAHGEFLLDRRRLEHDADPLAEVPARRPGIHSEHGHRPARPVTMPLEYLDGGGLSGSVRAEQREYLTGGNGEIYAVDGAHVPVMLDQALDFDHQAHFRLGLFMVSKVGHTRRRSPGRIGEPPSVAG